MPILDWLNRGEAIEQVKRLPYRLLESVPDLSFGDPDSENMLVQGDEIAVVTQGKTLDETVRNLQEAVALHLEGENLEEMGLAPNPTLILTGIFQS